MSGTETFFASPERATDVELAKSHARIESQALFKRTLDSLPDVLLILNACRQIVYLNESVLKMLGLDRLEKACGMRPGELFRCEHASNAPNGCGTSKFCQTCGLVKSILETQQTNAKSQHECRVTSEDSGEAMDLLVTSNPLAIEDETFTIITLEDISDEKRRQALERIFFHDIMNIAGGIQGISSLLGSGGGAQLKHLAEMMEIASGSLIEEIKAQKQLNQAEKGELSVNAEPLNSQDVVRNVAAIYRGHEVAEGKSILEEPLASICFKSDRTILTRVVGNMLKNALEATPGGGSVRVGCVDLPGSGELEFRVANGGFIPHDVQLQVFQRSFSTKGDGRGLGTYSIRLLGERYLKGSVGFESTEAAGTVFRIRLKKGPLE